MSIAAYRLTQQPSKLCIVVGLGLLGEAVSKRLSLHGVCIHTPASLLNVGWEKPVELITQIQSLIEIQNSHFLELIWAAGRAGFTATDMQMQAEYDYFVTVVNALSAIVNTKLKVNFLSSAGGIYENSGFVDELPCETPSRPYAHWKLRQEKFLQENNIAPRIYRVSSVYGFGNLNARAGLINVLLKSANFKQAVMIYANQNTLRDYIYNDDVANCVVNDILNDANQSVKILASGRAISVNSLVNLVENITKHKVMATFCANKSNNKNIAFSERVLTDHQSITTLEEGIRLLNAKMLFDGAGS